MGETARAGRLWMALRRAGDCQDRIDAHPGIGGAEHDQIRLAEGLQHAGRRTGLLGAVEMKARDFWLALAADKIFLEGQGAFIGIDPGGELDHR